MSGTRVPITISEANDYVNNSDDHLQSSREPSGTAVYELLGLTSANADGWHARRLNWRDNLYPKWSNKDLKTKTVVKNVKDFLTEFRTFSRPLLNIMAASPNAIVQDETILRFVKNPKKPVRPTAPITEVVLLAVQSIGGGGFRFSARYPSDEDRYSIPEDASGLEIRWKIGSIEEVPANVDECTKHHISTRARFSLNVGAENHNKNIYLFARWTDIHNPSRAGDWTDMKMSGIL